MGGETSRGAFCSAPLHKLMWGWGMSVGVGGTGEIVHGINYSPVFTWLLPLCVYVWK